MTHRLNCPTRWEAERQGERAYERGEFHNPYERTPFSRDHCKEAERSWDDGRRSARLRDEEQQEEDRINRRAAERRRWALESEEQEWSQHQEDEQFREDEYWFLMEQEELLDRAEYFPGRWW